MATTNFTVAGKCRCSNNPVQFEYSKEPYEVHYCLCTDCTDTCGGAMAIIAVVEKNAFKILQGNEKIQNFDTKPTCHRKFCKVCGCHMFLYGDGFPDFVLIHAPTLDRAQDVGKRPDQWVFVNSKHPLVVLPEDGLPRHPGWEPTASA
jgi:hypothetical protein